MSLQTKRIILIVAGLTFLASLVFVQRMEVVRKQEEVGLIPPAILVQASG